MKKIIKKAFELKQLKWQNFIFLLIAGCINAFGVTVFLAPVKLYDSGISGTSILLSQITPEYMSLSVFLLILNISIFYGRHFVSRIFLANFTIAKKKIICYNLNRTNVRRRIRKMRQYLCIDLNNAESKVMPILLF